MDLRKRNRAFAAAAQRWSFCVRHHPALLVEYTGTAEGMAFMSSGASRCSRSEVTQMTSCFLNSRRRPTWLQPARLAIAGWAAVIAMGDHAGAASGRNERAVVSVEQRAAGAPIMAIVSLRNQRITVYDANGWILRAPVSSGQKGRETPAGIFSVIEKQAEHYSNLYDDAYMPHMQRITWSGIALHGGPLPGYAASHGCIRLPYDFAEHLFGATKLGMRVIVAPTDVAPVEIVHPALFSPKPGAGAVAAARAAEAARAANAADHARLAAAAASREVAHATIPVRAAEKLKLRAESQLAAAERAVASASSAEAKEQADDATAKAVARVAEISTQVAAAKAELQPKLDASASAREAAVTAENARVAAAEAAREVARDLEPVSVFISRKTQRLYVRQAFQPILDSPVTIQDADRPIGTHIFTALERIGDGNMRWSAVSLDGGRPNDGVAEPRAPTRGRGGGDSEPISTDPAAAKAALDRIAIPQDVLDRIAGIASVRSSLIISDEALSSETSKGTDFVVLMSGEPQGGIKFRRRGFETAARYERSRYRVPYWRSPFAGPFSTW
jgi:L,D-transpeptidase catalytic domain